jgi:GDPmannose 4,6-dehydratase
MTKKTLICGISGQDGSYLARLLLDKGYEVYGTSRDAQMSSFRNLHFLGIFDQVRLKSMAQNDFRSVLQVLTKVKPDEIYNLAGWKARHKMQDVVRMMIESEQKND